MKHTRRDGTKFVRGRRDHALVVVGAIVVGIGIGGVGAVLAGGSPSDRRSAFDAPEASRQQARTPIETSRSEPRLTLDPTPVDLPDPAPDPNALADGVYPTFVRAVDVDGATITVDVLQVFAGAEQRQAAIEDGVDWSLVMYDPVYIRNTNPLLRKLPVAWDVRIQFYGSCDHPSRWAGLTELRTEAASGGEGWYYEITVEDGDVTGIEQKVASSGC